MSYDDCDNDNIEITDMDMSLYENSLNEYEPECISILEQEDKKYLSNEEFV